MADNKKKAEGLLKLDFGNLFQAEGLDAKEIQVLGGLTPIYEPQRAFEEKWGPVFGPMKGIRKLPTVVRAGRPYTPYMIVVAAWAECNGVRGDETKGTFEIVPCKRGDEIMIPIGGNLGVMHDLLGRAIHRSEFFVCGFGIEGYVVTEKGLNPMCKWHVECHPAGKPRAGTPYQLITPWPDQVVLPDGEVVDAAALTGDVASKLVRPAKELPAASS